MRRYKPGLIKQQKILLRLDLNVPVKDDKITDYTRIYKSLITIKSLLQDNNKIIIISHFGRPKGNIIPGMSLKIVADAISEILGKKVDFVINLKDINTNNSEIILLENLRFNKEEEENNEDFAYNLANYADIYINDAFSCSHRAHSSIVAITKFLPSYAGLLLQDEIDNLEKIFKDNQKPKLAIIGGSKISTKINILNSLINNMDYIIIAGAMANTFLRALNYNVGKSLIEENQIEVAKNIISTAKNKLCQIMLPIDVIVANDLKDINSIETTKLEDIPDSKMVLDIGPQSIINICNLLENVKMVIWNGPLGAFECQPFDNATNMIAKKVSELTNQASIISIAGGGDTISALKENSINFSYISTAGGAFLEWLEGIELPGLKALK